MFWLPWLETPTTPCRNLPPQEDAVQVKREEHTPKKTRWTKEEQGRRAFSVFCCNRVECGCECACARTCVQACARTRVRWIASERECRCVCACATKTPRGSALTYTNTHSPPHAHTYSHQTSFPLPRTPAHSHSHILSCAYYHTQSPLLSRLCLHPYGETRKRGREKVSECLGTSKIKRERKDAWHS